MMQVEKDNDGGCDSGKIRTSRYSSRPYLEPSRPSPDCFVPPKGATYTTSFVISSDFTQTNLFYAVNSHMSFTDNKHEYYPNRTQSPTWEGLGMFKYSSQLKFGKIKNYFPLIELVKTQLSIRKIYKRRWTHLKETGLSRILKYLGWDEAFV